MIIIGSLIRKSEKETYAKMGISVYEKKKRKEKYPVKS